MSQTFFHNCLKCGVRYEDTEPEPYFCVECLRARQQLAAQVDAQFAGKVSTRQKSALEEFDEHAVQYKTPDGRTISFMRA